MFKLITFAVIFRKFYFYPITRCQIQIHPQFFRKTTTVISCRLTISSVLIGKRVKLIYKTSKIKKGLLLFLLGSFLFFDTLVEVEGFEPSSKRCRNKYQRTYGCKYTKFR